MELWERAAPLRVLDELLRSCATGGRVALVAGEAGVGKSVLMGEFARRADRRARFHWGWCDPLVTPRALGPVHDIARHSSGALAERLAAGAAPEEILAALLDQLDHPAARPVLVVEDIHWADEATLDLLVLLGRRIGRQHALLVVTYRDDEVGAGHPLHRALAALRGTRIPLAPLSPERVAAEAARTGRDAATVLALTGGNPLLLTELLGAAGDRAPESVRGLILDRIRALPAAARELARLVAVAPGRCDQALLAGRDDQIEACIAGGVLVPTDDGVAYRHELLRTAVEDSLTPRQRTALHATALDALIGTGGVDPGRLVHHARGAGDADSVLRWGRIAAAAAARQGARREAADHYRAAAAHADRLPLAEQADLLERYSAAAYLAGTAADGLVPRRAAIAIRERLGELEALGASWRWLSRIAWWAGDSAESRSAADRAVTVLAALPPGRELAMAYSNLSQLLMLDYEFAEAIELGEKARALAEEFGDGETAIHAAINVGSSQMQLELPGGQDTLEAAYAAAAAAGHVDHATRALLNIAGGLAEQARFTAAAPALDRAVGYAREQDLDGYLQCLLGTRAGVKLQAGDWAGAITDADESLRLPAQGGIGRVPALVALGRIHGARGDQSLALSYLDEADRHAGPAREMQWVGPTKSARAEHFRWYGDPERAAAEVRPALARAAGQRAAPHSGELALRLWQADGRTSAPEGALAPYRWMVDGDWRQAANDWHQRGGHFLRLEALALGDLDAVTEAVRGLDALGATHAAQWLRGDLRRRGLRGVPRGPRRTTVSHPAGLTPRQAEVLGLLVDGLSNADIADRLRLAPKTVDHHVSAVLARLGVTSRGQAAARARKLGISPHSPEGPAS
ncbi:regulatory LuxR family protein [Asanoa ferruginea]|uniref:Regulatory LuxR family protein n=1 Tax=Asanoa ferruginea TaxID=53367 RepID=A0A3D9ZNF8_9ACTN|nr:AAA family ATPase [Asanoa ferruginea]REF98154.1 regulatory LuxR family protein [Asanoa ferruginea]GIF50879.1 LuxR family transcriptional regulator [Asanoa ferruginea]